MTGLLGLRRDDGVERLTSAARNSTARPAIRRRRLAADRRRDRQCVHDDAWRLL